MELRADKQLTFMLSYFCNQTFKQLVYKHKLTMLTTLWVITINLDDASVLN